MNLSIRLKDFRGVGVCVQAEDMAAAIHSGIADAPALGDLESGETTRLKIGYFKHAARDIAGATVSFHYGSGDTADRVVDEVEPLLDKRKFKVETDGVPNYRQSKSWDIGWVELNANGEIVDYEIDTQYLKPTEQ